MSSSGNPISAYRPHDGHASGYEQQEKSEEDEVVRGVRQRSGVAALADMPADVPDEAEQRADEGRDEQRHGQRHPRRSFELAARPLGEIVQPGDAAHPVQIADPDQAGRDHQRDDRHADHLVEGCPATLTALGGQRNTSRHQRKPHCHPTAEFGHQRTDS
jgi:hypothetical protein